MITIKILLKQTCLLSKYGADASLSALNKTLWAIIFYFITILKADYIYP
jgi:hypothetical protein